MYIGLKLITLPSNTSILYSFISLFHIFIALGLPSTLNSGTGRRRSFWDSKTRNRETVHMKKRRSQNKGGAALFSCFVFIIPNCFVSFTA